MEGGSISGNDSASTVYCVSYAVIVMEDGEISDNITNYNRAAIYFNNGPGSITMWGGRISGNTRGVYIKNSVTFTMEDGEISNNGISTVTGPYTLGTSYDCSDGHGSNIINGGGVFLQRTSSSSSLASFIMTGGKLLDNGDNDVLGSGIFQYGGYTSVTLNGPVEIRGTSINAYAHSTTARSPITVGENFVNLAIDPIAVDVVGYTSTATSASSLRSLFTAAPAQPIVSDVAKLDFFTTGKAGIADTIRFTIFANSYRINDSTGLITNIP
jgi:hypothetical protein